MKNLPLYPFNAPEQLAAPAALIRRITEWNKNVDAVQKEAALVEAERAAVLSEMDATKLDLMGVGEHWRSTIQLEQEALKHCRELDAILRDLGELAKGAIEAADQAHAAANEKVRKALLAAGFVDTMNINERGRIMPADLFRCPPVKAAREALDAAKAWPGVFRSWHELINARMAELEASIRKAYTSAV
jgi:hypothetical protein